VGDIFAPNKGRLSQKSNPLPEGVVQGKGSTVRSRYYGSP
jgi:hypothetical protein